jgi:hypothetical protein
MIGTLVKPIHFDDYDGVDFERLVFAYHLRAGWLDVAWYGQTGSDQGRDIAAVEPLDDKPNRRTVIQCVNRSTLPLAKCVRDMERACQSATSVPDAFKFVSRAKVSAKRRDEIIEAARKLQIFHVVVWSGSEFEEHLRLRAEPLLRRFVNGESFPDSGEDLKRLADGFSGMSDDEILRMMAIVFDRPAFHTPFQSESSLPAFQKAIEDTIGALNTGIWRTRDGHQIRRIPSLHAIGDANRRAGLLRTVRELDKVRYLFRGFIAEGSIRHCGCGKSDCPVFMVDPHAGHALDEARKKALDTFRSL